MRKFNVLIWGSTDIINDQQFCEWPAEKHSLGPLQLLDWTVPESIWFSSDRNALLMLRCWILPWVRRRRERVFLRSWWESRLTTLTNLCSSPLRNRMVSVRMIITSLTHRERAWRQELPFITTRFALFWKTRSSRHLNMKLSTLNWSKRTKQMKRKAFTKWTQSVWPYIQSRAKYFASPCTEYTRNWLRGKLSPSKYQDSSSTVFTEAKPSDPNAKSSSITLSLRPNKASPFWL